MKNLWLFFLLFFTFFIVHFLLIPAKIFTKNIYKPDNYFYVEQKEYIDTEHDGYFYNENECGYFAIDQGTIHYTRTDSKKHITANNFFYLEYQKVGTNINLFSPRGEKINIIKSYGYPYISGDFPIFYIIKTNGMGFSSYDINGEPLIEEIDFTSIISSINTDHNNNTLISTIDGITYLYSPKGKVLFQTKGNNSQIIISKSNAINNNGSKIAICSGINPEYIEIYQKETGKMTKQIKTNTNFRYEIFMHFFENRIYYEGKNRINYYDIKTKKNGYFEINGAISDIVFNKNGALLISTTDNELSHINIFSPKGEKIFYKEFKEPISDFKFINKETFYFKLDNMLIKMKI